MASACLWMQSMSVGGVRILVEAPHSVRASVHYRSIALTAGWIVQLLVQIHRLQGSVRQTFDTHLQAAAF